MGMTYKSIWGKIYEKSRMKSVKLIFSSSTMSNKGISLTRKNTQYRIIKLAKKGASISVAI